jgi:hypothetical protein
MITKGKYIMKNIVLSAVVAASTLIATQSIAATNSDNLIVCTAMSELASKIMTHRQSGTPMSVLLTAINNNPQDPKVEKLAQAMVIDAYEIPSYNTARSQNRAVLEFENTIMLQCIQTLK